MPPWWLRLALIVVLVLVFWWLVATLGRGIAGKSTNGTGIVIPIEERLVA
jgi:flagellar biogenesis protein FliO